MVIVRIRLCTVGIAAAMAISIASCGDDGDATGSFGTGSQFSVTAALAELPLLHATGPGGEIEVYVGDLLAAGEATGQVRPTGSDDAHDAATWLGPMIGTAGEAPVFVPVSATFTRSLDQLEEFRAEMGFSVTDVDALIEVNAPPLSIIVVSGAIDPIPGGSDGDGVQTIGDGEDFAVDPSARTAARPLGMPLRRAARDNLTLVTTSTDAARDWLDDSTDRLDADPAFSLAAAILDDHGVLGAALFRHPDLGYEAVAIGWGTSAERGEITVVQVTGSDSEATEAEPRIETAWRSATSLRTDRPLAELVVLENITTSGPAVVATLTPPPENSRPRVVLDMVLARERPFVRDA